MLSGFLRRTNHQIAMRMAETPATQPTTIPAIAPPPSPAPLGDGGGVGVGLGVGEVEVDGCGEPSVPVLVGWLE